MSEILTSIRSLLWGSRWRRALSVIAASLLGLVLIAWAVVEIWLIPKAAERVAHELALRGFHISYRDPDLALLRGSLSLKDITLYRTAAKKEPLLFVSEFGVRIDLGELIWRQALWGEGEIRDGKMIVYGQRENTELDGLDAAFDVDLARLRILGFDGDSNFGYRLQLAGEVRWAADVGADAPAAEPAASPGGGSAGSTPPGPPAAPEPESEGYPDFPGDFAWLEGIVDIFRCEPAGEAAPTAELELIWDETRPRTRREDGASVPLHQLLVRGTIGGQDVTWQNLPLENYRVEFAFENWEVAMPSVELRGLGGAVSGTGVYHLDSSRLELRDLRSDIDAVAALQRLNAGAAEELANLEYDTPPALRSDRAMIDFRDLNASELGFAIDAPGGIRYRDGDEVLAVDTLAGSVAFQGQGGLLFENIDATINGLRVAGRVALRGAVDDGDTAPADAPPTSSTAPAPAPVSSPPAPADSAPDPGGPSSLVSLLNNLLQLESEPGRAPRLDLDIELDPDRGLAGLALSGSFAGSNFTWHGRKIETAELDIAFSDGLLELGGVRFAGLGGEFEGGGSYHFGDRALSIPTLRSTVDLATFREELGVELPESLPAIEFPAPPTLDIDGFKVEFGDVVQGRGRIEFGTGEGFTLRDGEDAITAKHFNLSMAWTEAQVLSVEQASGRFGDLDFSGGGELRWDGPAPAAPAPAPAGGPSTVPAGAVADTEVSPAAERTVGAEARQEPSVIALLKDYFTVESKGEPVKVVGEFSWDGRSKGEAKREWYEQLEFEAEITGRDYTWREFAVIASKGKMALRDAALKFGPFTLGTSEGSIESEATLDIASKRLHLATLQLTIDPVVAIDRLGIPLKGPMGKVDFLGQPVITGSDVLLDFADMEASAGTLTLSKADGIALITPKGRKAVLGNVQGVLQFGSGVAEAKDVTAEFLKGKARFDLKMVRDAAAPSYEVKVRVDDISIAAANDWLDPANQVIETGVFDLNFEGKGTDSLVSLEGEGLAKIGADAPAARDFPVLSGLMGALEGFFPILRGDQSWELDLPFTVSGAKISTDNTRLTSRRVSATVRGHVDWVNGQVDLIASVNLRGLIGVVANLARPFRSGFVEIVGRGPVDNVSWGLAATEGRREEREEPRRGVIPRPFRNR